MPSVALFIKHRTQPGRRDEVRTVWERFMQPAIAENSAHETYIYCYDANDPDTIFVYQQYSDSASAQAFLETPSYKQYLREVEPLLASQPDVSQGTPMWIKDP